MGVVELLFSFKGRIARSQFWLGQIALIGILASLFVLWWLSAAGTLNGFDRASKAHSHAAIIIGAVGAGMFSIVLMIWIGNALAVKRLHDRGKSGWWVFVCIVPTILHYIVPSAPVSAILLLANIWYLVECGFLRGEDGANAYGPGATFDAGYLVSRDVAELRKQATPRASAGAADLPGPPSGVIKPRPVQAGAERQAGFGRRSHRPA